METRDSGRMTTPTPLEGLAARIQDRCVKGVESGEFTPQVEMLEQEVVEEFSTDEHDFGPRRSSSKQVPLKSWILALHQVMAEAKEDPGYAEALAYCKSESARRVSPESMLESWLRDVAHGAVSGEEFDLPGSVEELRLGLRDEPPESTSNAELQGVVILTAPFEVSLPDAKLKLRPVEKADFEKPRRGDFWGEVGSHHERPTAVCAVTMRSHGGSELQSVVDKVCRTLNLFRVGGARLVSLHFGRRGYRGFGGILRHGPRPYVARRVVLRHDDGDPLRDFFRTIWARLPSSYDRDPQETSWSIAYARYEEALEVGTWESQIATAVMGLEGLLLGEDERNELTYKLTMRLAKIAALLDEPSYPLIERLKAAYHVRSVHVHGGKLSYKQRQKLERQFGALDGLLLDVLNWLRRLLAMFLVCIIDKDQFLDALDDAMLQSHHHANLQSRVSGFKKFM